MSKLTAELAAFMESLMQRADPATAELISRTQGSGAPPSLAAGAIDVGDVAPDFTLKDQHGAQVSLYGQLAQGPVVLIFVRGGWCPFCELTLRAFRQIVPALQRVPATLLAVSPQSLPNNEITAERCGLSFPLLSDTNLRTAEQYGLVWEPDAQLQATYLRLGHDVPRINGNGNWRLPIPAGYVISPDHVVRAARREPNLAHRLQPSLALAAVEALTDAPDRTRPAATESAVTGMAAAL